MKYPTRLTFPMFLSVSVILGMMYLSLTVIAGQKERRTVKQYSWRNEVVKITTFETKEKLIAIGQQQERIIRKKSWGNEPIKIAKLKVKGTGIALGQKFLADDDWLKDLTIEFKNTSDKTIVFIDLRITIPAPTESSPENGVVENVFYGKDNETPGADANSPARPVLPGESAAIQLTDRDVSVIRNMLGSINHSGKVKEISLLIDQVIFEDGVKWYDGETFRRDPRHPTSWIKIS